jgi:glutaconyl-CoA/methylmalonyl-CoA decarboxylase subunit gamma
VDYRVSLQPESQSEPVVVVLIEQPSGALTATVDGRRVEVDAVRVGSQFSVRVDGQVVDLTASGKLPELALAAAGLRTRARVESDRTRPSPPAVHRSAQGKTLRSPMPGRVVRVSVQAGDDVRAGQALVVVEAMKMENEVFAAWPGTVLEVHVSAGAAVEANAKLITLSGSGAATAAPAGNPMKIPSR